MTLLRPHLLATLFPATALLAATPSAPGVRDAVGAVLIPFTQPVDGTASIGLYNPGGRLVRVLAQNIELPAGPRVIRWDGLDLWGNLVPENTELEARVFSGPGLSAAYQFAIASPSPVAWPTRPFGEGENQRTGGWLGDHGTAVSVAAAGDRVIVGSFMAEHGHTVAVCNLEGDKVFGRGGLEGWEGPRLLATDGTAVFGAVKRNHLHRLSLDGTTAAQIADTGEDEISGLAAHAGTVWLTLRNHEVFGSLVQPRVNGRDFDFAACQPVPDSAKAYNRLLTGQEQFAHAFFDGGHPQAGVTPAVHPENPAAAGVAAVFRHPVTVGTLLVERLEIPARLEAYALRAGLEPGPAHPNPKPGEAPGPDWEKIGESDLSRRLNVLPAPAAVETRALCLRLTATEGAAPKKWPRLTMCRILPRVLERADIPVQPILPAGILPGRQQRGAQPGDPGWSFRAAEPPSETDPARVVLDYGTAVSFDAVVLLNLVNARVFLDAWTGPGTPGADAPGWTEIARHDPGVDKVEGSRSASVHSNDQRVSLPSTVTTRALRLRLPEGQGPGRWAEPANTADPLLCEAADVALLRLRGGRPKAAEMILQARDGVTGEVRLETRDPALTLAAIACDRAGGFTALSGNRLVRLFPPTAPGAAARVEPLGNHTFSNAVSLAVSEDGTRLAVGDAGAHAVELFDAEGRKTGRIGGIGPRRAGPWNPRTVEQPVAVAIDRRNQIWVCERTYTPKRVTLYTAAGEPVRELLGPPHYGGGGWLDSSLRRFIYEAAEYEVDYAAGTSRLKNLLDVQADPNTPTLEKGSYTYTKVGRPVRHNGRLYLVGDPGSQYSPGGMVVCRLEEGASVWKPAAVLARAAECEFLLREDKPWRDHWLRQDLSRSSFIWCDLNDDGVGQVEEVQLFRDEEVTGDPKARTFDHVYWGNMAGPDLTFWGSRARLAPSHFTPGGAPVYERARIQPFDYAKLAPVHTGLMVNDSSAKNAYGGASMVARDGCLILEGQPYRVKPDLTLAGGPLEEKPSGYLPPVLGARVDNPLSFIGSAATRSPVGEVAMINGNNGRWFLWAVDHGLCVGEIFTGRDGGWGSVTNVVRGMDVTGRKQDWETFFGHFTATDDGGYAVVAGRGHWGVSRVGGIDEITVARVPVRVEPAARAANAELRERLVAAAKAARPREKRELKVQPLARRAKAFALDGDLADWGKPGDFQTIGAAPLAFDAAWDAEYLTLAFRGAGPTGNQSHDWRYLFKTGFGFDLFLRADPAAAGDAVVPGDLRVVLGRHQSEWVAVRHDHLLASGRGAEAVDYTSPVTATPVDRVARLPADAARVAFRETSDGWTAEVRLRWSDLGVTPRAGLKLRADAGIRIADTAGLQADRRVQWSDPDTGHVADLAVEARIRPAAWGTWILQ